MDLFSSGILKVCAHQKMIDNNAPYIAMNKTGSFVFQMPRLPRHVVEDINENCHAHFKCDYNDKGIRFISKVKDRKW